jgi:hypothetical protein
MKSYILSAILEHGLSIRQIPASVREVWGYNEKLIKPEYKIEWLVVDSKLTAEQFQTRIDRGFLTRDVFKYEDNKLWRKYMTNVRIPQNAGYWMCKKVTHTSSTVQWDMKTDNLAPTLGLSIKAYLNSIK